MPEARRLRLPVVQTRTGKYMAAVLVALICAALYILPSQYAAERARTIALFAWEQRLPWLPQAVWPYLAQYPLLVAAYAACGDLRRCSRFLHAALLAQAVAAVAFVAMPLRYPREAFPAAWPADPVTAALADWVRSIDAPVNCLPSLHVTSCLFCVLLARGGRGYWPLVVNAVAVASIASTLPFKQHQVLDLLAGACLAVAAWGIAGRLLQPPPPGPRKAPAAP